MMIKEIYKAVAIIEPTALQTYLRKTKWVEIEVPKPEVALFQKTINNQLYEVFLPLSKHFGDYTQRIVDVLEVISETEQRPIRKIVAVLILLPNDKNRSFEIV
jgi:hypothetical protein